MFRLIAFLALLPAMAFAATPAELSRLQKALSTDALMAILSEEGAVQVFRPLISNDYIVGAVGVLQFDVTMERLKVEYGVDAVYEGVDYATARWVGSADPKKQAEFEKKSQANLALDAEGNLTYLAPSEWRLGYVMEQWPDIEFAKTREHD